MEGAPAVEGAAEGAEGAPAGAEGAPAEGAAKPPAEDENTIMINDISFTLVHRCKLSERDESFKIFIKSVNLGSGKENSFYVYPSSSDLGFWRLAYWDMGSFQKGPDYVQSSFISLRLQSFIDERISHLKEVSCDDIQYEALQAEEMFNKIINNGERQIQLKNKAMKDLLEKTHSHRCGYKVKIEHIQEISKLLGEIYTIKNPEATYEYTMKRKIEARGNEWYIKGKIYSINLIPQEKPVAEPQEDELEEIILYYFDAKIRIKYKYGGSFSFVVSYPILVIKEDKINEYGVYDGYINLNSYICKMFEYIVQVDKDQLSEVDAEGILKYPGIITPDVDDRYMYIGDFYKELFPINDIALPVELDDDDSDWSVVDVDELLESQIGDNS
tara:strand:+ start:7109 stop:8266 length:1158 start_codon:yes stop_codon:yes gene_type:complete